MWIAERAFAQQAAIAQPAGDRLDHAQFKRLGRFERRQDAGHSRRQHRFAGAGRPDHQPIEGVETSLPTPTGQVEVPAMSDLRASIVRVTASAEADARPRAYSYLRF